MDEVATNKAFQVGYDRTEDLCKLVPDGPEGEAELVGHVVASLIELSSRWNMSVKEALKNVKSIL